MTDRHAWTTSGLEAVAHGVFRIPLPLPNDALRAVNVYAVRGQDSVGLIDGGWFIPEALDALRRGLAEIDVELDDISTVLATHFHRDHYTLAVELQRLTGCSIALGAGERATVDAIMAGEHALDVFVPMLIRAGAADLAAQLGQPRDDASKQYTHPTTWLTDGDVRQVGGRDLAALSTPGHTQGHFCFADESDELLFAGDHVLPHITPSIGFETARAHLPLGDYLTSLLRIRERKDTRLLPAHGPVTPSVHERVDELLRHHDDRLRSCADAVDAGARTANDVARRLTWTRRERALGELVPFDQALAVHETVAHLDVLVVRGRLRADRSGAIVTFTTG